MNKIKEEYVMFQEILSPHDIEQIHHTSMRVLANVGVEFPLAAALDAFKAHGVKTDGTRVYLSEDQVWQALETVPQQFTLHGRDPARSVTVGDGRPVLAPGYGAPFLVDAQAGKRVPTVQDYRNLVKLAHALPNQDVSGYLLVEPGDVPPETAHLHMLYAHMVHSDKPFIGSVAGAQGVRDTMAMIQILFDDVGQRAVTMGVISGLSPLGYSPDMLEALVGYAKAGQPLIIAALMMAGTTGPVTLPGLLALQNAELLAGITLSQLIHPGLPVIYGSTSTNIDMRSGALAIGSPELAQLVAAHLQLVRYYGIPGRSGGTLTDASFPDAQAGAESMMGMLTALNSGADFVLHAGGILSSYLAFSYEKFVLDDEICGAVRHFHRPWVVDDETLAYDVVANVGPGGNFLMEDHTFKRCRSAFWQPALSDRGGLEAWEQAGRPDAVDRARQRWQKLLAAHKDPPLDATTARQLEAYVAERLEEA
jgi:trimethylamine---corrinoid protein Co-methyltransferase